MQLRAKTGKGVGQRDLARIFNVSQATVSRALRGTGQVKDGLAERLIEAARKHGYSVEAQFGARALIHRRHGNRVATNVICAIVHDTGEGAAHFNTRVLRGIERGADEAGSDLLIAPRAFPNRLPRVVIRRQVDGVVWLLSDADFFTRDPTCPVPFVSVLFAVPGADQVAVDDRGAMQALGKHLADLGHRRIAFVGPDSALARERLAGLRVALGRTGGAVRDEDVRMEKGAMAADTIAPLVRALMERRQVKRSGDRFTVIAAYNDYMAATVIRCICEEHRLRVPQDLSVTGFDGIDVSGSSTIELTTMAIPLEELGAKASRLIAWRLLHPNTARKRVVVEAKLVIGKTVGRIRSE